MPAQFKSNLAQRIVSLALIVVMGFNPVLGQPEITLSISRTASETYTSVYQDLRFRWYANGYAGRFASLLPTFRAGVGTGYTGYAFAGTFATLMMLLFQGDLNKRPKRPDPEPQEKQSDRDAKVAGIRIHPGGVVNLNTGEQVVFATSAYDPNGASVTGVKVKWEAEAITVGKKKYKGKFAISPHGRFSSPDAGEFIVTARKGSHSAQVRVIVTGETVLPLPKQRLHDD
jgi:hypothetical protein